jgi:CRP-like cAMP-binding protein
MPAVMRPPSCLDEAPWFTALPPHLQELTRRTAEEKTAGPGETLARAGDPSSHWFGVVQGFVQMYVTGMDGTETTLYCLRQGEWGGEGSLLKRETRRYHLVALTPSRVCLVPAATFHVLHAESLAFNHFLVSNMNDRMAVFIGMLEASRLLAPELRVAKCLLMLAQGRRAGDAAPLCIPQHELALICGLSRQRTNMALRALKRKNLVRVDWKGIDYLDVPGIEAYVAEAPCRG